jgi:hypothetical protein
MIRSGDVVTSVTALTEFAEWDSCLTQMLMRVMLDTWSNQDTDVVMRCR